GTWEPGAALPREKPKWPTHQGLSPDAGHRGGWARRSGEGPGMGLERRGPIIPSRRGVNPAMGRNRAARQGRQRPGDKSRMSREAPVRFREGLGVKLPRATRLILGFDGPKEEAEAIKAQLGRFLSEQLKLELSPEN